MSVLYTVICMRAARIFGDITQVDSTHEMALQGAGLWCKASF